MDNWISFIISQVFLQITVYLSQSSLAVGLTHLPMQLRKEKQEYMYNLQPECLYSLLLLIR